MKTSAFPKTAGANAMGKDIRDFYDLKRQSIKDDKGPSEIINR